MSDETLLQDAVQDVLNQPKRDPETPPCSLVITFHNTGMIPMLKEELTKAGISLSRHDNYLYRVCDSKEQARHERQTIEAIVNRFDDALLVQPFNPRWLENYLSRKKAGVNVVMEMPQLRCEERIPDYLNDLAKSDAQMREYEQEREQFKRTMARYSLSQFAADLAAFLSANFAREQKHAARLALTATTLVDTLQDAAHQRYFLEDHVCQDLIHALEGKEQALTDNSLECAEAQITAQRELRKQASSVNRHRLAGEMKESVLTLLQKQSVAPLAADNPFIPFAGPVMEISSNPNVMLTPERSQDLADEQDVSREEAVASTIVRYFVDMMLMKHEAALEKALVNLSWSMDTVSFSEALPGIAANTRPVL